MHDLGVHIFEVLRRHFEAHGYLTLFSALLLENAGIPVPGETVLLFASFLAFSMRQLHLPEIIVIGIVAATLGDNLGYLLGRRGGRPLLERYLETFRISRQMLARGERLFEGYGNLTIFFARFVVGLRIMAGPLAGVLRMPWQRFLLFNFLGAASWVTVISLAGFKFGEHWGDLTKALGGLNLLVAAVAFYAGFLIWRRFRTRPEPQGDSRAR